MSGTSPPDLIFCPAGGIDAQKAKDYLTLAKWLAVAAREWPRRGKAELLARQAFAPGRHH